MNAKPWYQKAYRRILVDMHIPDQDGKFLSQYDPLRMAKLYEKDGVSSVLFYFQSHVGLCYYPTQIGRMHAGLKGRDVAGELLGHLRKRDLATCGYYSTIYNNWAYLEHPEWRIQPSSDISDGSFAGLRYGHCCPNNPGYRAFVMEQIREIVTRYPVDGMFFDMVFWPAVCLCPSCRELFRKETGKEIPETINWFSPDWCRFQKAREQWLDGFASALTRQVKELKPAMTVYHNYGAVMYNWTLGVPANSAVHHDFLGGDFYGDPVEQCLVSKMMVNRSENQPVDFMTSICVNLRDHVRLKEEVLMETQAFAATMFGAAFMFIDAINPDGTINTRPHERIARVFRKTAVYEPWLGGEPVEDIGTYFSTDAKVDFTENGLPLKSAPMWHNDYPHLQAVRGACRTLLEAHLPFGIITRKQLPQLGRYRVLILPNVLRMDREEIEAFRQYVKDGGRLYASRSTSLTGTDGTRHPDFQMADLFGCHYAGEYPGMISYLKPAGPAMRKIFLPQEYLSQVLLRGTLLVKSSSGGMLLLDERCEGRILATLTLPYASPGDGTVSDGKWASIHSAPPWEDTPRPVLVENRLGKGRVIYCAGDIETVACEANDRLFRHLVLLLLEDTPAWCAETHPAVWMTVFHQPENRRLVVSFLNYQLQMPSVPIPLVRFTLRAPDGKRYKKLLRLPGQSKVPFTVDRKGTLHAEIRGLAVFQMLLAEYGDSKPTRKP